MAAASNGSSVKSTTLPVAGEPVQHPPLLEDDVARVEAAQPEGRWWRLDARASDV
jgi:hypothetical protein